LFISYLKIINKEKPDVVLTYTIKPNIYGSLAASILRVSYIPNVTGLGSAVMSQGLINKMAKLLYKVSLRKALCVFFQNTENERYMLENKLLEGHYRLIPGSGVNLQKHSFEDYPANGKINVLYVGRLMREKGISEFLKAAEIIKKRYKSVEFHIIGSMEDSYNEEILKELRDKKVINYYGSQKDVHKFIKNSHVTVNPSYHEGMSNVLLESASTGRPVLASNIPGCRETFDEGISGFGFEVKNVDSLVETLIKFIELPYEKKQSMGLAGRNKIEREFDRNIVVNAYLEEIDKIVNEVEK
jgi:galacturonosyltransferase